MLSHPAYGALPTVQSEAAAALKAELAELGRERDRVDERVRQLRQQRLRVRPKDLQTLERARALERAHFASSPQLEGVKQLHRASAAAAVEEAEVKGRIGELKRQHKARLEQLERRRAQVARAETELRLLRGEVLEGEGLGARPRYTHR